MIEQEKLLIVLAHALARQDNDLQHLKALVIEKLNIPFEEIQREQETFWAQSKNYRVYQILHTLQTLQHDMEKLPEGLTLDMYADHLRWPSDPPEENPGDASPT